MFYGNELDAEKHLLLNSNNRVLLVGQNKTVFDLIQRAIPNQFSLVTVDNTVNKIINNLNCPLLKYTTVFKLDLNVTEDIEVLQNKLLWLHLQLDDLHKFLWDLVEIEKQADREADAFKIMLDKKAEYFAEHPEEKFISYLFDVDACLYCADYQSMYEFEDEAIGMFNRVDFSDDLDTIKAAMVNQVKTTYVQNYTHVHNSIKDFFAENLTK